MSEQSRVLIGLPVRAQLGLEGAYFCCLLDADAANFVLDWQEEVQGMELPPGARLTLDFWAQEGTLQRLGKSQAGVYAVPDDVREALQASGNGLVWDTAVIRTFEESIGDTLIPGVARLEMDHQGEMQLVGETLKENLADGDVYVTVRADLDTWLLSEITVQSNEAENRPGI